MNYLILFFCSTELEIPDDIKFRVEEAIDTEEKNLTIEWNPNLVQNSMIFVYLCEEAATTKTCFVSFSNHFFLWEKLCKVTHIQYRVVSSKKAEPIYFSWCRLPLLSFTTRLSLNKPANHHCWIKMTRNFSTLLVDWNQVHGLGELYWLL